MGGGTGWEILPLFHHLLCNCNRRPFDHLFNHLPFHYLLFNHSHLPFASRITNLVKLLNPTTEE